MNKLEKGIDNRIENLTKIISEKFGDLSPWDLDTNAKAFTHSVMNMYQVTRIRKNRIELTHLFNDEIIYPVYVDKRIRNCMRKNDTFLIRLGLKDSDWQILHMSPPYSTEGF